jgi:hypothetical protein
MLGVVLMEGVNESASKWIQTTLNLGNGRPLVKVVNAVALQIIVLRSHKASGVERRQLSRRKHGQIYCGIREKDRPALSLFLKRLALSDNVYSRGQEERKEK